MGTAETAEFERQNSRKNRIYEEESDSEKESEQIRIGSLTLTRLFFRRVVFVFLHGCGEGFWKSLCPYDYADKLTIFV